MTERSLDRGHHECGGHIGDDQDNRSAESPGDVVDEILGQGVESLFVDDAKSRDQAHDHGDGEEQICDGPRAAPKGVGPMLAAEQPSHEARQDSTDNESRGNRNGGPEPLLVHQSSSPSVSKF